jgi:hypothetical protein
MRRSCERFMRKEKGAEVDSGGTVSKRNSLLQDETERSSIWYSFSLRQRLVRPMPRTSAVRE